MRRKFNQKGLLGELAFGVFAIIGGIMFVDSINKGAYDFLRTICIGFDSVVYSVSSWAYSIFYEISSSSLLSSLNLASASQRLYTLLGIFMLFRLAFSFIKYIINPEEMEKGTSKLLTNLAVSLALIVSVPWIFNRAFALQNYIMDSNIIGNLIMGMDTTSISKNDDFNASSYGQTIGFLTFSAFYRPDSSIPQLSPCNNLLTYYSDYVIPAGDRVVTVDESVKMSDAARKEADKIAACINALNEPEISTGDTEIGTMLYIASQRQSIGLYANSALLRAQYGNTYLMNYTYLVSTIAGGFLALLFLNFSFDVAIRNVKLCFLQIIAPIPIILNIEPGEAKGDKKSLNWWVKECLQTYALLFIRVATVYFGVFLIELLFGSGLNFGSENTSVWFKIFMILGILLFVKQVPDMLGKAFGIDVKGEFKLNPLKRIGENKLTSGILGGAIGFAGGALGGGFAAYRGARANNAKISQALLSAVDGFGAGAVRGAVTGTKKGSKTVHDLTSNFTENMNRRGRIAGANVGTTPIGRARASIAMATGSPTDADRIDNEAKILEEYGNTFTNQKNFALGSKEKTGVRRYIGGGYRIESTDTPAFNNYLNDLKAEADEADKKGDKDKAERMNRLYDYYSKDFVKNAINRGTISIAVGNCSGDSFDNVKDANDYLERLRASGASVADLKAAEDLVSASVNNYIDKYENVEGHAVNTMRSNAETKRKQNAKLFKHYNIPEVHDAASSKAAITPTKSAAVTHKSGKTAMRANANKAAAQANRGGGR